MDEITLPRPDDCHLHLRDGAGLAAVVAASARVFARAVVMPNLLPPVTTVDLALAYRQRILACLPPGADFTPLMSLYLTDLTTIADVRAAATEPAVVAVKLYPAGATTNSAAGVTALERLDPVLAEMAVVGLPLLVHGEVTDPAVDPFDREAAFVERVLAPLVERHPCLRVVLEHVTTAEGVDFVLAARDGVAATVTPHHLLLNRGALFAGGLRPHLFCLPVLKRERHRQAVVAAATGSSDRFFLGSDSAPHGRRRKEADCGCAGVYNAPVALEVCAEVFAAAGGLDRLAAFVVERGARFYRLPVNAGTVTLRREGWTVPASLPFGDDEVVPLCAGESVGWRVVGSA